MTGKKAHIISHTHWDREWYLPYEKHHARLIKLIDTLLDTLATHSDYKSFFLDGQTIILEDYLQVRPERKEELAKYIRQGRIGIGPWYVLQDAFLTSSEANVRNMQIGQQDAEAYGKIAKIGYFPDTFGIYGQAPQLLRQAGIDNALFGRGVKPTGFNNQVTDAAYESSFSEMVWEGADGSKVLGILFANWYSNGNEVPANEEAARVFWKRKLAETERFASTNELLYMNGCDHQPIQQDLPEAIALANKLYPDVEFVHSNFEDYLAAVRSSITEDNNLSTIHGELRSQRTDGWSTLVNTASARVYLKQSNQLAQSLLESTAEPLAALAHKLGSPYPHHLFKYAWKTLMQNHPHDSICGCSVDDVHREMMTRFDKSRHMTEAIIDDSKNVIVSAINTACIKTWGDKALPFTVFNTSGWKRSGTVSVEIDAERIYFRDESSLPKIINKLKEVQLAGRRLLNEQGDIIPCSVEDLGEQFGYDLPDDRFRQPYMSRKVKLTFEASDIPALGWRTYAWSKNSIEHGSMTDSSKPIAINDRVLENDYLRVEVKDDGSLTVTDFIHGTVFDDLLIFEDSGDIGNEYMYRQPEGEQLITTKGKAAAIRLIENFGHRAVLEIVHEMEIPAGGNAIFEQEKREAVYFPERKGGRVTDETVVLIIRAKVSLERSGRGVGIDVTVHNNARDHRVRALFPTRLQTGHHYADSIFEVVKRKNEPEPEWVNPSFCHHQQKFVDVSSESAGLSVANQGLHEYEIVRDGRNTIAVTLLRAVGELGDWGVFPTPEAQCLGEHHFRMLLLPHGGEADRFQAYARAYQFNIAWEAAQADIHGGDLLPCDSMLDWEGDALALTSVKIAEKTGDFMVRWYNMGSTESQLSIRVPQYKRIYKSDILENDAGTEEESRQEEAGTSIRRKVQPCEIFTLGFTLQ